MMGHRVNSQPLCVSLYYHCDLGEIFDSDVHKSALSNPVEIPLSLSCLKILQK